MPPQVSFSKEVLLNKAFEIVRKEGLGALTARKIAQELNCSTQPIYRSFRSMKELEAAVIEKAKEYTVTYFLQEGETEEPFINVGLQYFKFAREEKELFKLLYMSGRITIDLEDANSPFFNLLLERMKQDPYLEGLDDESLKRIRTNMWIFTHGLITLVSVNSLENSENFVYNCLRQMERIVIEWEHYHKIEEKRGRS